MSSVESIVSMRGERLEDRTLLAFDFGDAPDTAAGTGEGNYETLAANGGPSHTVVAGLFLGDSVDADSGTLQNSAATADDVDAAIPDDEDGVLAPVELLATAGSVPTVSVLVTNTTGSLASLVGWIDYDQDGVFDNVGERAETSVATGTVDGRIPLTFPKIPADAVGQTYLRLRLSTDSSVANPTGSASDGEVEDYAFSISARNNGEVATASKIATGTVNGPTINDGERHQRMFRPNATSRCNASIRPLRSPRHACPPVSLKGEIFPAAIDRLAVQAAIAGILPTASSRVQ